MFSELKSKISNAKIFGCTFRKEIMIAHTYVGKLVNNFQFLESFNFVKYAFAIMARKNCQIY